VILAARGGDDALFGDTAALEVLRDGARAALRKLPVEIRAADVVGVAGDLDDGLVVFLRHLRDAVEHLEELRVQVRAAGAERDVAGHVEDDVLALARDRHAAVAHQSSQLVFLPVLVVADGAAGERADAGAHEGALPALLRVVAGNHPDRGARARADQRAEGRARRLFFSGVGIGGGLATDAEAGGDDEGRFCRWVRNGHVLGLLSRYCTAFLEKLSSMYF